MTVTKTVSRIVVEKVSTTVTTSLPITVEMKVLMNMGQLSKLCKLKSIWQRRWRRRRRGTYRGSC